MSVYVRLCVAANQRARERGLCVCVCGSSQTLLCNVMSHLNEHTVKRLY